MLWSMVTAALLVLGPTPEKIQAQERLKLGQQMMSAEKFEEAAAAFREAIRLDPSLIMAHYGLGQAHMGLKQYPAAVAGFRAARDAFHTLAADDLNRRLENDTRREDRIRNLQDKIRHNERAAPANSAAARQREILVQQWEIEISSLQRARGDHDTVPEVPAFLSLALGSAHFRNGELADAEREYRAALAVKPTLGEPRNNLAVVLLLTGRPADAKEQLRIAEKNGFRVPPGLMRDVDAALSKASPARD